MDVQSLSSATPSAGIGELAKAQGEYSARVFRRSLDIAAQGAADLARMVGESQGLGQNVNTVG